MKEVNSFLRDVATSLYKEYGEKLSTMDIVFASRRAAIYFDEELKKITATSPRRYTIDKWITSQDKRHQEITTPPNLILISKLHNIYQEFYEETLEHFYSFGELILSDFNMVDRYMVDPVKLYGNIKDIKNMESDMLPNDDTYQTALDFWKLFDKENEGKFAERQFKEVWNNLLTIYTKFNEQLDTEKISYPGKTYRRVAQNFKNGSYSTKRHTVFVGLNALSQSEKEILRSIDTTRVDFIWDYDQNWSNSSIEADYFICQNIKEFPQANYFKTTIKEQKEVKVEVLKSPSDFMQSKITGEILQQLKNSPQLNSTAIILTDESLLLPLLHSIPQEITSLNISMGYPLKASTAGRLLNILISLQNSAKNESDTEVSFKKAELQKLLGTPYTRSNELAELLNSSAELRIFSSELSEKIPSLSFLWQKKRLHSYLTEAFKTLATEELEPQEALFIDGVNEALATVEGVMKLYGKELSKELYLKVLKNAIAEKKIYFEGVSGSGLQIMGILESRSLDFDRVIMLSLSDDNFPSSRPENSYIPSVLLKCFGMPTIIDKSAIWSYYFYRLLQRSSHLSLIYCNVADTKSTGEPSRYLLQMKYNSEFDYNEKAVRLPSISPQAEHSISIIKSNEDVAKLKAQRYSPSALTKYLQCPLSFYLQYIKNIGKDEQLADEGVTPAEQGDIVHGSLEKIYNEGRYLPRLRVKEIIEEQITQHIESKKNSAAAKIVISEIFAMIDSALRYDSTQKNIANFKALEKTFTLKLNGYNLKCVIDRIDTLTDGTYRVIDYKTGKVEFSAPSMEAIFSTDEDVNPKGKVYKEILQTLIYSYLCHQQFDSAPITPKIYALRQMTPSTIDKFSGEISIGKLKISSPLTETQYTEIAEGLTKLLSTICDISIPFTQCRDEAHCTYCDYTSICRR